VTSRWGTGGGNVPLVSAYVLQGNMIGRQDHNGPQGDGINEEVSFTLNTIDRHAVSYQTEVRRLTPIECERLQGFPDNYTNIPWNGKAEAPDGHRYKALGNSMAVPVMQWIGDGIDML
jgi:DNA (cytosine-5)-methyltransferase 1